MKCGKKAYQVAELCEAFELSKSGYYAARGNAHLRNERKGE